MKNCPKRPVPKTGLYLPKSLDVGHVFGREGVRGSKHNPTFTKKKQKKKKSKKKKKAKKKKSKKKKKTGIS